ncbi:hypothetical protein PSTT_10276 [Puccinia striiformis]|uniref:DUF7872 domain-containing protein n=1 Tax=Puccinia striiformis TaxID=27350 RepID=A0A2S4V540_9BASI|nr:hypothetical protein PSTT_10276 [Puccinia striiformis]
MGIAPTKQAFPMTFSIVILWLIFNLHPSSTSGLLNQLRVGLDKPNTQAPYNNTLTQAQTSCAKKPLTQRLWHDLNLDAYLENYTGGKTLSVVAFANQVNMTNFACGIGRFCDAGELCSSAKAPAWYILVGIQNWNDMMNSIYKSIAFAVGTVQEQAPSMVSDLSPPLSPFPIKVATIINIIAASRGTTTTGCSEWIYQVDPLRMASFFITRSRSRNGGQYNTINPSSGISTEKGIYGQLKNGTFLQPGAQASSVALQRSLEEIIKVQLLAAILRSQNVYITRGSVGSMHQGRTKWGVPRPGHIIILWQRWRNDEHRPGSWLKTGMKFYGSSKIIDKHKFSVGFLTESAWKCQSKYGQYDYNPYTNGTVPTDVNSDCLFNLPVCDCTDPHIAKARKKGMRTTKACHRAGVPVYAKDQNSDQRIGLSTK